MHDPMHLLAGIRIRRLRIDIWHIEPGGADAWTVCGMSPETGWARIRWGARHVRHLHVRFWPYLHVKRWIRDRCDGCGRRFLWKDSRHSYMGTDKVWHDPCMSLRTVRGQLDDLTAHVRGTDDWNTNWRAKYRLDGIEKAEPTPDQETL